MLNGLVKNGQLIYQRSSRILKFWAKIGYDCHPWIATKRIQYKYQFFNTPYIVVRNKMKFSVFRGSGPKVTWSYPQRSLVRTPDWSGLLTQEKMLMQDAYTSLLNSRVTNGVLNAIFPFWAKIKIVITTSCEDLWKKTYSPEMGVKT